MPATGRKQSFALVLAAKTELAQAQLIPCPNGAPPHTLYTAAAPG